MNIVKIEVNNDEFTQIASRKYTILSEFFNVILFDLFFATMFTRQGTCLGLSLAHDIVKAHGGTLEMQMNEGLASEYLILLPFKTT